MIVVFCSCRSTYMDRTIASARSFLAGLFTSNNKIQANGKFKSFDIDLNGFEMFIRAI